MKVSIWAWAAVAGAVAAAGVWWAVRPRPLVAGTHADFPPFESREGGEIAGFDVDLARAVAEAAGRRLKVEHREFNELLPALEAGGVDLVVAAMGITAERRAAADFSAPYYRATQVVLIRKGEPVPVSQEDLRGRRIGAQLGTPGAAAAAEYTAEENLRRAASPLAAVVDLMNSQVDVVILDEEPAIRFEQKNPELQLVRLGFAEEVYGVAVRRGDAELLGTVNRVLAEMAADGRHARLVDRWLVRMVERAAD